MNASAAIADPLLLRVKRQAQDGETVLRTGALLLGALYLATGGGSYQRRSERLWKDLV